MDSQTFIHFCINQHDVVCNQKYNGLPYSFHLNCVHDQFTVFKCLLNPEDQDIAEQVCFGHDLIEDARVTYNDILQISSFEVAEAIYACTEEKGRNRLARHSSAYYDGLAGNRIGLFVKLCDIMANVTFSVLTASTMYNKYKLEYERVRRELYFERYEPMFVYLDKLFSLK